MFFFFQTYETALFLILLCNYCFKSETTNVITETTATTVRSIPTPLPLMSRMTIQRANEKNSGVNIGI